MAPCKGCERRKIGCHSKCEDYKLFREWIDDINEKKRQDYRNEYEIIRRMYWNVRRKDRGK